MSLPCFSLYMYFYISGIIKCNMPCCMFVLFYFYLLLKWFSHKLVSCWNRTSREKSWFCDTVSSFLFLFLIYELFDIISKNSLYWFFYTARSKSHWYIYLVWLIIYFISICYYVLILPNLKIWQTYFFCFNCVIHKIITLWPRTKT